MSATEPTTTSSQPTTDAPVVKTYLVEDLKAQFAELLTKVHHDDLLYFKVAVNHLLDDRIAKEDLKPKKIPKAKKKGLKYLSKDKEELLEAIIQELRSSLPVNAEARLLSECEAE